MAKCDCYYQHGMKYLCYGTKEMEECSCGCDTSKCDFYPEKRNQKTMANEKRLIDVNAIPESATAISTDGRLFVAWSAIVEAPTVAAVEVVHGWWMPGNKANPQMPVCSSCKSFATRKSNYCPNCGAKMDGDGNG